MTKTVRIENADTSSYKVRVLVQDKVFLDGIWTGEWNTTSTVELPNPTNMTNGLYITSSRRLIVEEFE